MTLVACATGVQAEAAYRRGSILACQLAGGRHDMRDAEETVALWFDADHQRHQAIDEAERIAGALVRSAKGASAVRSMADVLWSRGRIGSDAIDAACSAAYGTPFAFDRWAETWPPTLAQVRSDFIPPTRRRSAA